MCGALRREYFQNFDRADQLDRLAKVDAPGAVHMTTVAPEIKGGIDLIRELVQEGSDAGGVDVDAGIVDAVRTEPIGQFADLLFEFHRSSE